MRLFTIDNNGKLIPYQEHIFGNDNRESDLEILLEKNPEYFFEKSKILIIGRQVQTNLGSWIDLLGLDQHGNTFNAGIISRQQVHGFNLVAFVFCKPAVHP